VKYWFYFVCKAVLWIFFRVGFGLEVRGQQHVPAHGGFVLASNHLSYLDPPLLGAACNRRLAFMARDTLFEHWLLGAFLRAVHVFPLQREGGDLGAMREAIRRLKHGDGVALFPEGGRQFSGQPDRAKRGVGLLAVSAKAPIIPVVIRGTLEALPPGARRLRRAKIQVAFGEQISYTERRFSSDRSSGHQTLADAVTAAWRHLADDISHG